MTDALAVLAHQGGWDEILIVIGAVVVLFALWKVLDRVRGIPDEPHRWDRDRGGTGTRGTADGAADGAGEASTGGEPDGRD